MNIEDFLINHEDTSWFADKIDYEIDYSIYLTESIVEDRSIIYEKRKRIIEKILKKDDE